MALATLTDLQTAIQNFGQGRTDISTADINDMITLAENDIEHGTYNGEGRPITRPLRVRSMETKVDAFALSGEYTNLPSDYLEMREVWLTSQASWPPLRFVTPEAFDDTYAAGASGPPTAYSVVGTQLRVGPGAGVTDTCRLIYYATIPNLVTNSTNWLLTGWPNVYLYGALRHLAPYIGALEMLPVWQAAFVSALGGLIASQTRGSFSGTSMAVRTPGVTIR